MSILAGVPAAPPNGLSGGVLYAFREPNQVSRRKLDSELTNAPGLALQIRDDRSSALTKLGMEAIHVPYEDHRLGSAGALGKRGIADKLQTHVVASCCTVGGRVTPSPLTFEAEAVGTEREERVNVRARNDRRDTDEHRCGAGQRIGLQLQQTALTVNAMP